MQVGWTFPTCPFYWVVVTNKLANCLLVVWVFEAQPVVDVCKWAVRAVTISVQIAVIDAQFLPVLALQLVAGNGVGRVVANKHSLALHLLDLWRN